MTPIDARIYHPTMAPAWRQSALAIADGLCRSMTGFELIAMTGAVLTQARVALARTGAAPCAPRS
jgi:hypothetical protein